MSSLASHFGVKVHPGVTIEDSPLGGTGVFFDSSNYPGADIELLRIPYSSVWDYNTLLELLEHLKTLGLHEPIVQLLTDCEPESETEIILCYVYALYALRHHEALAKWKPYLELLHDLEPPTYQLGDYSDGFLARLAAKTPLVNVPNMAEDSVVRLTHAVMSRVLEIPHVADPNHPDDFTTNVTLVPVLDFVNHLNHHNAAFDVDKQSKDVLLVLKTPQKGKFEVTINYSPDAPVQHLLTTYGFVPPLEDGHPFQLEVDLLHSGIPHHDRISRWLVVQPEVVVSLRDGRPEVDLGRVPLLFIPGLEYHDWRQESDDVAEIAQEFGIDPAEIKDLIEAYENPNAPPMVWDNIGVKFHDTYVSRDDILEQTGHDSPDKWASLADSARQYIEALAAKGGSAEGLAGEYLAYRAAIVDAIKQHGLTIVPDSGRF